MNNILFIMMDQLRFDALGHIGKFPVKTTNIDALVASGTSFDNAYCSNPVCVPARASLMTGVNSYEHGVYYNDQNWPEAMPTFVEKLAANCYYTTVIGKRHFFPVNRSAGFQKMVGSDEHKAYLKENGYEKKRNLNAKISDVNDLNNAYPIEPTNVPLEHYRPVYYTERALHELDLIASRRECQGLDCEPFFMKLSYELPHTPCNPPEPYFSMYGKDDIPPPNATPDELSNFSKQMKKFHAIWDQMNEERLLKNRAQYFGCVTLIDEMIGRVIQKLKDLNIYDNTLIILTSDHGDHLCDHHLQQKGSFYECSAKVPFIFSGPGIPQGKVVNENVSHIDLYPTLLEYCNLSMPKLRDAEGNLIYVDTYETDNMSLMPYFTSDGPVNPERIIISENAIQGQRFMLKKGDVKINCYINKDADNEFDYYNVKDDPDEQNNMGKSFSVNDFDPDMKEQYDRVLKETKKLESGHYFFQKKVRPMFT